MTLIKIPHQHVKDILDLYEPNDAFAELANKHTTSIKLISHAMEQELFADAVTFLPMPCPFANLYGGRSLALLHSPTGMKTKPMPFVLPKLGYTPLMKPAADSPNRWQIKRVWKTVLAGQRKLHFGVVAV